MSKVLITRSKLDNLASTIGTKSGAALPLTLDQMNTAVQSISGGGVDTSQDTVDAAHLLDGYTAHDSTGTQIVGSYTPPTFTTQTKSVTPTTSQQTITPDSGYDGLSSVDVSVGAISGTYVGSQVSRFTLSEDWVVTPTETQTMVMGNGEYLEGGDIYVGAIPSDYVGSNITRRSSTDLTASGDTVTVPAGYYSAQASKAVASGTAGTPTASKSSVSNHSVSVTPSVTNQTGYITGSTKTGTAVTVSASELVSGSETKTENGTYDVTNLASLVVNVAGSSKNVQVAQSTTRSTSTSGTQVISLTCSTAGTYTVQWSTFRSSTSGTWGSRLYIGGTAYETMQTSGWSNHVQNREVTGVSISANQAVAVYVQSRGSNYYGYVGTMTIVQTA